MTKLNETQKNSVKTGNAILEETKTIKLVKELKIYNKQFLDELQDFNMKIMRMEAGLIPLEIDFKEWSRLFYKAGYLHFTLDSFIDRTIKDDEYSRKLNK